MDFRKKAKYYFDEFGFNVLPVENKIPKGGWEKWETEQMTSVDIDSLNWNTSTNGIVAVLGIKNLRCLDFDDVKDDEIVKHFVAGLGLPQEYDWIVRSGNGYHMWFYCDDDPSLYKMLCGEKAYYKLQLKEKELCDHIELRWKKCQTVLPPSYHPDGKQYEFVNVREGEPPLLRAQNVEAGKLIEVLKEYCNIVEPRGEGCNSIVFKSEKTKFDKRFMKDAAEYLKGKVDNYEDYLRIGFALASLGEEGREYFLSICKNNPQYSEDTEEILNKKFDGLIKDYRGDITLGSFFEIAKRYGFKSSKIRFWLIDRDKVKIIRNTLIEFLEAKGFGKIFLGKDYIFIQIKNNIVWEISPVIIKDYVLEYINELTDQGLRMIVKECLIRNANILFNETTLECLQTVEPNFVEDTKEKALFFFNNCFVEVTDTDIKIKYYEEMKDNIWEKQLIKRDFSFTNDKADFKQFITNVCKNDPSRINSLKSAIGYSLHSYKDPTRAKAIIFADEKLSENAFGRSGKELVHK